MSKKNGTRDQCSVCTESYNASTRSEIICSFCKYQSCLSCSKEYMLSKPLPIHCMNCRKAWNRSFLDLYFPKTFITGALKQYMEQKLFEHESSLLADTQPFVEYQNQLSWAREEIKKKEALIKKLTEEIHVMHKEIQTLSASTIRHKEIVKRCPNTNCRGFISDQMCGLCKTIVCSECLEIKIDEHTCLIENIESIRQIKKDTKNCPNCYVPIFKSNGCDQMWCVKCNVAFDWKTGRLEQGIIHNPHYFKYLEELRPTRHDMKQCTLPPVEVVIQHLELNFPKEASLCMNIYRLMNHWKNNELSKLPTPMDHMCNRDLRSDYLKNELTETRFKETLYRRAKEREKKLEYREIIEAYVSIVEEFLLRMMSSASVKDIITEEQKVRSYLNQQIVELGKRYNATFHPIGFSHLT